MACLPRNSDRRTRTVAGLALIGLIEAGLARSAVRLPKLVGDNMVLQRDTVLSLWGYADPGESVRIAFHGLQRTARADRQGRWKIRVGPFAAGGPFEMTVRAANTLSLHNILIGDVWLAAGQSNMEFPLANDGNFGGVDNADTEVASAHYPQIRLVALNHTVALRPREDVETAGWGEATPATVASFSAIAYLFGRELHRRYAVPIGLIQATWGGTAIEAWVADRPLRNFAEFREPLASLNATDEATALADHRRYLKQKAQWDRQHLGEDRGRGDNGDTWAAPDFDVRAWPTLVEPQSHAEPSLKGFDGAVWFRKEIELAPEDAGQSLNLHLGTAGESDTTFFNGRRVGETKGEDRVRHYTVPGQWVVGGRNVITVRATGRAGLVGMFGEPSRFRAESAHTNIPLAGPWSFQPGPDLRDLPEPSVWARLEAKPNVATLIFNGMIAPITTHTIKGVIWYQGETDARRQRAAQYRILFPALIADWRRRWSADFPFLFVQLAGWGRDEPQPARSSWAELREAQGMALSLAHTGMATAIDVGDEFALHPRNKQAVAHRLSLAAASVAYGETIVHSGPTFQSMRIVGREAHIQFANVGSGLRIADRYGYARGFQIAGEDGKFFWAQARREGEGLVVFSEAVDHPRCVRYDWGGTPDGNLFNEEGLPATPFRTDAP